MSDDPRSLSEGLHGTLDRLSRRFQDDAPQDDSGAGERTGQAVEVVPHDTAGQDATEAKVADWTYTPSVFAQLSLPYRDPGDAAKWVRTNGRMTLVVTPGRWLDPMTGQLREGYPYGVLPRLVVLWMATEAKRTRQPELVLGPSLSGFISKLSVGRGGGPNGSFTRLGDQLRRMLTATVTVLDQRPAGQLSEHRGGTFIVASDFRLWWSRDPLDTNEPLWESTVTLSAEFYAQIASEALPLRTEDLAALRAKTSSPLALDTYTWFAHRLHRVQGSSVLAPWTDLAVQFGGNYTRLRAFKAHFLRELVHVQAVYPAAKVAPERDGLRLWRSPSPVPPSSRFLRRRSTPVESPPSPHHRFSGVHREELHRGQD